MIFSCQTQIGPWDPRVNYLRFLLFILVGSLFCACAKPPKGQRWIKDLELHGNKTFKQGEIVEGLATEKTGWWPFAEKHWFDKAAFETDFSRIATFYAEHGFFEAKVVGHKEIPSEDNESVSVHITIEEGASCKVKEFKLNGVAKLSSDLQNKVAKELPIKPNERFDYGTYSKAKGIVLARLKRLGFAYAKVLGQVEVNRDEKWVKVEITADTGPRVKIGKIVLKGNGPIPEDKILNLVTFESGDYFNPVEITRTRARLNNQQVFSMVRIELPKEPTSVAKVELTVSPGKLRELHLGGGIGIERSRHELRLKGTWIWRNFLGGMRVLRVQLQPAFVTIPTVWASERLGPAVTSDVKLTQPDIFGTGISVFGLVGYDLGIHEGYQFHGPKAQAGTERAFFDDMLRVGISWNLTFLDFFDVDKEAFDPTKTPLGLEFVNPYRPAWIEPFVEFDWRDDRKDPRAGLFARVRVEQGVPFLGSQFNYFKVVPELRGYVPLGTKRLVLALRSMFGYLRPAEGESTPVTRRISFGGPTSHRGFSYGRLSPQGIDTKNDQRVPLGGNAAVLFSGDLRFRMFKLFDNWLSLTAFADAGDVVANIEALALDKMHVAVGGSLLYDTPIGAIRFGVGVRLNRLEETMQDGRPNPDPGERIAYHLTIGTAF